MHFMPFIADVLMASFSFEYLDKIVWKREKSGDKRIGERDSMEGYLKPKILIYSYCISLLYLFGLGYRSFHG